MNTVSIKISNLVQSEFGPFGKVLGPIDSKPYYSENGLEFWHGIDKIIVKEGKAQLSWLEIKGPRPFFCREMERHNNCSTTIIQMEGRSVVLFGQSQKNKSNKTLPNPDTIKAFLFDGTRGVNLKPGTWFWNRYPLTKNTSYIFILGKDFDTEIVDLEEELGIIIDLDIKSQLYS
jgi:ureidoglycolate hydrolase